MAVLVGASLVVLLTCLLFLIRLYIVLKSGPNYKPGTKGSVAVLIVAGSGNVNDIHLHPCNTVPLICAVVFWVITS